MHTLSFTLTAPSLSPCKWYPMMPLFYQADSTLLAQSLSAPLIRPNSKPSTPILAFALSKLHLAFVWFSPTTFLSFHYCLFLNLIPIPAPHHSNSQPSLPANTPRQRWLQAPSFLMVPYDISSGGDGRSPSFSAWGETSSQIKRHTPSPRALTHRDAAVEDWAHRKKD